MPDAVVLCGGLTGRRRAGKQLLELDVSHRASTSHRIDFTTERIMAPLADDIPDVIADAVEVAAYVFCADRLVRRGAAVQSSRIGSEWERRLSFRIPVRRPDIWERPEVRSCLIDVLSFLSGDRFEIEFAPASAPVNVEPFLGFGDANAQVIRPDLVMMFSGGLDSLAGVAQEVLGAGKSAILVTHQSANTIIEHQNRLAAAVKQRSRAGQLYYAPVRVRRGVAKPIEHSQRLRSFLFATLGMAYARMFGLDRVHFFENGITSFNLPIAEHVLGTRASRTTHPKVLAGYERLFSHLLETEIRFNNPFLWQTKADVVRTIAQHGCGNLIPLTTSCAAVRNFSMTGQQCGVCSQCVERRIAIAAAGFDGADGPYQTDFFAGPIEDGRALTMVEGHLLRARRLSGMSQTAFLANHGHAFRAYKHMGLPTEAAARRTFELHQRYGKEFVQVVNGELASRASIEGIRSVNPHSLLGMVLPHEPLGPSVLDGSEREPIAERQPPKGRPRRIMIAFALDRTRKRVVFANGPELKGVAYKLFEKLVEHQEAEAKAGEPHSYVLTKNLAPALGKHEEALRTQINRHRAELRRQFEEHLGYTLDLHDVIQNDHWKGYRINPNVLVLTVSQLAGAAELSRNRSSDVTERTHSR